MNAFSKHVLLFAMLALALAPVACGGSDDAEVAGAPAGAPPPPDAGDTPSDEQVIKDVSGNASGILSVELDKANGKKAWDSTNSQYFWEKWVTIKRNANLAEAPDAKLIVYGFARYEITAGKYNYREFKVNSNSFEGIKAPSEAEALEFVKGHMQDIFPGRADSIVNPDAIVVKMPAKDAIAWEWDNPKSVAFNIDIKYEIEQGGIAVATKEGSLRVKLFRETADGPWNNIIAISDDTKETSVKDYDRAALQALPHGFPAAERAGNRRRTGN